MDEARVGGEGSYLSIGEVLGLLLEEFPDVTISKIRFLESQGLIDPERTPSGYRKFYEPDVERLKVILRQQRQNFLPLKVIRDRLESGVIDGDPSGSMNAPRGIRNVTVDGRDSGSDIGSPGNDADTPPAASTVAYLQELDRTPADSSRHPSGAGRITLAPTPVSLAEPAGSDRLSADELCTAATISREQLGQLESFGVVPARTGPGQTYSQGDVAIAEAAGRFLSHGVEARHLRGWRQSADREASLFEQMILPMIRQRNPQARHQAVSTLQELSSLGAELRAAIVHSALKQHLDR